MAERKKGYTCECGKFHEFPMYVHAHWDTELTNRCTCGRKHLILRGFATELKNQRLKPRPNTDNL